MVVTLTLTLPYLAFAGTLHLIRVLLQETYLAHFLTPNFTKLVPRLAPNPLPLITTVVPRLPEAGLSLVSLGNAAPPSVVAMMTPALPTAQAWLASLEARP